MMFPLRIVETVLLTITGLIAVYAMFTVYAPDEYGEEKPAPMMTFMFFLGALTQIIAIVLIWFSFSS